MTLKSFVKANVNKVLLCLIIWLTGCQSSQLQHCQRVEKMRIGIPALFSVEVDYYKDLENKGPEKMTERQEIEYWLSQGVDPKLMNPNLPEPQIKSNTHLLPRKRE